MRIQNERKLRLIILLDLLYKNKVRKTEELFYEDYLRSSLFIEDLELLEKNNLILNHENLSRKGKRWLTHLRPKMVRLYRLQRYKNIGKEVP